MPYLDPNKVTLHYMDNNSDFHEQTVGDIFDQGTLIDPDTGEDMVVDYISTVSGPATVTEDINTTVAREMYEKTRLVTGDEPWEDLPKTRQFSIQSNVYESLKTILPVLVDHGWIAPHEDTYN